MTRTSAEQMKTRAEVTGAKKKPHNFAFFLHFMLVTFYLQKKNAKNENK